jgi:hypothetical protein
MVGAAKVLLQNPKCTPGLQYFSADLKRCAITYDQVLPLAGSRVRLSSGIYLMQFRQG